ncbi:bifunctional 4-hydroxy-2-oxoglutarate aldolase/2-dehydro-3-deoxy-phosphogluconate aldolase [Paenibacillus sp. FJAT-26967]|uniref:bifunctional 4-hydroxy-2-oxoglutarate aldolase/2-dehydro-3-deoxy-phosphogluconate aldolase n=1 Tax=Paenibacillus sp. FJAT-26967 TaxID=1729690 RepID=UPI000838FB30|nr:bifunctional 4-hydroxy-2-oxoglutarate aldolase/2-dehydro-3-deoxy-phosphogluconate aldolase [Paenibacillus sp. FJAT-26967]
MEMLEVVRKHKLIAILRQIPEDKADQAAEALIEGGIPLLEVTMDSAGAAASISRWRERYGQDAYIGAGTILDIATAQKAVEAGAQFLISPHFDEEIVEYGVKNGLEVWPGVFTPSEMVRALKAGAKAVKLFPAGALGASYIKDVKGPLADVPIIATGGIHLTNARSFLDAGVTGIGLGGSLLDKKLLAENKYTELKELARQFTQIAENGR